ncbi:unnamed protein product [Mytilus edulis]|uniref:Mutator-like transposase domain-containing protein n=1 Tax=Mytilus edulis TaxID=6550 RepID=A0A8S3U584_MYTED|nr:unnamed protein product [Mytilus edulis]
MFKLICLFNYHGHATFIGKETGSVLSFDLRSKTCKICEFHQNRKETVLEHQCHLNWHGSSKSMEADMTVSMVHRLKDDECEINAINADNDAVTSEPDLKLSLETFRKKMTRTMYKSLPNGKPLKSEGLKINEAANLSPGEFTMAISAVRDKKMEKRKEKKNSKEYKVNRIQKKRNRNTNERKHLVRER